MYVSTTCIYDMLKAVSLPFEQLRLFLALTRELSANTVELVHFLLLDKPVIGLAASPLHLLTWLGKDLDASATLAAVL